jgi:hypothetical protein
VPSQVWIGKFRLRLSLGTKKCLQQYTWITIDKRLTDVYIVVRDMCLDKVLEIINRG